MLKTQAEQMVALSTQPAAQVDALKPFIKPFFDLASHSSLQEVTEALRLLSRGIAAPNPQVSKFMGMLCGAMVERGAPARAISDALLARISAATKLARQFHEACHAAGSGEGSDDEAFEATTKNLADELPEAFAGWTSLNDFFPPAIAAFSSDPEVRRQGAGLLGDLELIAPHHGGAQWLSLVLKVLHNEPYLAIEPATMLGIQGRMTGISTNFQLNVLLMDRFPGSGKPRVSSETASIARGQGPQQGQDIVKGAWNLSTWKALGADGKLPGASGQSTIKSDMVNWIWNEGTPADIPVFDGLRIILLSPASYQRQWRSQRYFAHLSAELSVEQELSKTEVGRWIDRIAAAPR